MGEEMRPEEDVANVTEDGKMIKETQRDSSVPRLMPLNDVVFSCIFDDVEQTGPSMLEFLNAVLTSEGEEPIVEIIEMKSQYSLIPAGAKLKQGRLDVRVRSASGILFDVEVQLTRDAMNEREYFYGSKIASDNFKAGMSYEDLPRVVMIDICDFYIRKGSSEIVEPVRLMYAKGEREVASRAFEIFHIQLPEFRKYHKTLASVSGNRLLQWLYLFDKGYLSEEETEMLARTSEGMRRFVDRYGTAIMDPVLVERYDAYVEASHEEASRRIVAERRAAREAAREADLQASRKHARGMREKGMSLEDISDITGLSVEEIAVL